MLHERPSHHECSPPAARDFKNGSRTGISQQGTICGVWRGPHSAYVIPCAQRIDKPRSFAHDQLRCFFSTKYFFRNAALFSIRNSTEFFVRITSVESSMSPDCHRQPTQRRISGLRGVQYVLNAAQKLLGNQIIDTDR